MTLEKKISVIPWMLIVVFIFFSVGILLAGRFYYVRQKENRVRLAKDMLSSVADLKVDEIVRWRHERLGDAAVISKNPFIVDGIRRYIENPEDVLLKEWIRTSMQSLYQAYNYRRILLLDNKNKVLLSVPDAYGSVSAVTASFAEEALRTKEVVVADIHRSAKDDEIHINVIAPLPAPEPGAPPIGTIVFQISPEGFLFPLIQSWPAHSRSAETLLVRREGDSVVFLNELRHQKKTALVLRFPLSRVLLPAVMAVRGREGVVDGGIDYRHRQTYAALRKVPGSPWFLIAKMDKDEILGPINQQGRLIALVVCLLIISAGVSVGVLWVRQADVSRRREYEAEIERLAITKHFDYLSKYANDVILMMDAQHSIIEANDRAFEVYGYARDELLGMDLQQILGAEDWVSESEYGEKLTKTKGHIFETIHQRKDKTTFPVEVSARSIELGGERFYQAIIRDITDRKRAEAARQAAEQRLADIIEFLPDPTFVIDQDKKLIAWNHACEVLTGVKKQALLGQGDYAYAEAFYGERHPILIDLLDLPSSKWEPTYKHIQRKGDMIYAESFIPRLRGGGGLISGASRRLCSIGKGGVLAP